MPVDNPDEVPDIRIPEGYVAIKTSEFREFCNDLMCDGLHSTAMRLMDITEGDWTKRRYAT